jgi:hypothetical protein
MEEKSGSERQVSLGSPALRFVEREHHGFVLLPAEFEFLAVPEFFTAALIAYLANLACKLQPYGSVAVFRPMEFPPPRSVALISGFRVR